MSNDYELNELPGVGEIRARKGTSTVELAGAAAFWHKKYTKARNDGFVDGFVAAVSVMLTVELFAGIVWYYLRSH